MTASKTKSHIFKIALSAVAVLGIIFSSFLLLIPESIKAQNVAEQKSTQAASMELPSAEFEAQPSYLVRKGGEVSLFTKFQNYAGEGNQSENILYNWCIDGKPVNSLMAGSTDEVVEENGSTIIRNQYGVLRGGEGACNISDIYRPDDIALIFDNMTPSGENTDGVNAAKDRLKATFTGSDSAAVQRYIANDFIGRVRRSGVSGISLSVLETQMNDILNDSSLSDGDRRTQLQNVIDGLTPLTPLENTRLGSYFSTKAALSFAALDNDIKDRIFLTREVDQADNDGDGLPDDDIDGDGMSDTWEIQNFGKFAGKNGVKLKDPSAPSQGFEAIDFVPQFINDVFGIQKRNTVDIRPINFGGATPKEIYLDFLEDIKPEHDYDGDGFLWGENYGRCVEEFFKDAPKESTIKKIFDGETCWWKRGSELNFDLAIHLSNIVGFPVLPAGNTIVPGPIFEGWQAGIPYARLEGRNNGAAGNYANYEIKVDTGYFPNGAEFVFGTNPNEADTDADGIPDAYDVAGLRQNSIPLKIQKDDDYVIDVHLFGMSQKGALSRGEASTKYSTPDPVKPYNNTPYLFWRTDLEDQRLKVGGGLPLPTKLTYSPYPATIDNVGCSGNACAEPIRVQAATASGEVGSGSFFYTWYLDGIILPASEEELSAGAGVSEDVGYLKALGDRSQYGSDVNRKNGSGSATQSELKPSGFGKNAFEFNVAYGKTLWDKIYTQWSNLGPCAERRVGVDVLETQTGKTSHAELTIPIGTSVDFEEQLITNVDPSKDDLLAGFNLNDETLKREIIEESVRPILNDENAQNIYKEILDNNYSKDPTLSQVDPKKGYRKGDLVSVEANLSQKNNQCEAGYYDSLIYKWYFDDLFLENESGRGKSSVIVAMSNAGSDLRDQDDAGSHYLRFEAVDPNTNQIFARGLNELRVVNPYVHFPKPEGVESEANVTTDGIAGDIRTYKVQPGATVKIKAEPRNFRPLPDGSGGLGFEYEWIQNGEPIPGANQTVQGRIPSEVELEFTVDNDPDAYDEITLEIRTGADAALASDAEAKQSANSSVVFSANPPEDTSDITFGAASAAISRFIPEQYRQAFNGAFALGGFALLGFLAYALYRGKQQGT